MLHHLASLVESQVEVSPVQPHLKLVRSHDMVDAIVHVVLQRPPPHPSDHALALRFRPLKPQKQF